MNKITKQIAAIGLALMVLLTGGCAAGEPQSGSSSNSGEPQSAAAPTSTVTFNQKLVKISGLSPADFKADLEGSGIENYETITVNEDDSVSITVTDEQREYWLTSRERLLQDVKDNFTAIGENYSITYNADFTEIDFYFSKDLRESTAAYYISLAEVYSAMHQLFSGTAEDSWDFSTRIFNAINGNLVASGDSENGISWKAEDWDK